MHRASAALDVEVCPRRDEVVHEHEVPELGLAQLDDAVELLGGNLRQVGRGARLDHQPLALHHRRAVGLPPHAVLGVADPQIDLGDVALLRGHGLQPRGGLPLDDEAGELDAERRRLDLDVPTGPKLSPVDLEPGADLLEVGAELEPAGLPEVLVQQGPGRGTARELQPGRDEVGQRLEHRAFGAGEVVRILDSRRMRAVFDGQEKTLIQGLPPRD